MSTFPTTGTLKTRTLPGAMIELLQRAYNAKDAAPANTTINLGYSQTVASGNVSFPIRTVFRKPNEASIVPYYGENGRSATDWQMEFVDFDGNSIVSDFSSALMNLACILNDAERSANISNNLGITSLNFNDERQVLEMSFAFPIDIEVANNGQIRVDATDYVGRVSYEDALDVLLPPEVPEEEPEDAPGNSSGGNPNA